MFAGTVTVGAVVSTTYRVKLLPAELPAASVAVQVTSWLPSTATVTPLAGVQLVVTVPSTMSLAVGFVYVTPAPPGPVASAVTSACGAIVGGVVSTTYRWNVLVPVLPAASVAEQVTSWSPPTAT